MEGRLDGIRLWDGETDRGPSVLTWSGGRIREVRAAERERLPELCAIPGLVDTHVHMLGFAGAQGDPAGRDTFTWPLVTTREEQTLHAAANAGQALRGGVTTLRDLAGDEAQVAVRRAFDRAILPGPRVLVSGPVGMTAGHLDLFTPAAVRDRPPTADGPDACRALVRRWARTGLTGIKIFTRGGVLSVGDRVGWRNHTRAELEATIDEAHALGMLVAAHAHSVEGIRIAIDVGADSVEHGTELAAPEAAELVRRNIPVGPTLLINEIIAAGRGATGEAREKAAELVERRDALLRAAAAAGVRFVLATDASGYFVRFGDQMAEVARMVQVLGIDAARALRAATSDAADSIGIGGEVGRLGPGFGADLVVMRGRPWERIEDLDPANIVAVVCRGRVLSGALPG